MAERLRTILTKRNHRKFLRENPQRHVVALNITEKEKQQAVDEGLRKAQEIHQEYPQIVFNRDEIISDLAVLQPEAFGRPNDAINSHHDIRHHASVYAQARILAHIMQARHPHLPIDEKALRLSAPTHDMLRLLPEWIESIHGINVWHGKASGKLVARRSRNVDFRSVATAQEANTYHDYHHTPKNVQNPTLELLVAADRLELVRLLMDPFYGHPWNPLRGKFQKRMREYNESSFPGLIKEFTPLAKAIFILSVAYSNTKVAEAEQRKPVDPSVQVMGVIEALDTLGFLKPLSEESNVKESEKVLVLQKAA